MWQPWNAGGCAIVRDTDYNLLRHADGGDAMVTGSVHSLTVLRFRMQCDQVKNLLFPALPPATPTAVPKSTLVFMITVAGGWREERSIYIFGRGPGPLNINIKYITLVL